MTELELKHKTIRVTCSCGNKNLVCIISNGAGRDDFLSDEAFEIKAHLMVDSLKRLLSNGCCCKNLIPQDVDKYLLMISGKAEPEVKG